MKVSFKQFLGKCHSWAYVAHPIAQCMIEQGHEVHLFSTDGIEHLPDYLKNNLIGYMEENSSNVSGRQPDADYDMQFSYTSMINFQHHLKYGNKNKVGIWCYEWAGKNVLPKGFAKCVNYVDHLCPPSNFAKQVFLDSKVSENKIKVIPHGINVEQYQQISTIKLPTNKSFKILANIAQNHLRKNIPGLLTAYGKAFNKSDDVCLIIKAKHKKPKFPFDVSLEQCLQDFYKQFPNHGEVKILSEFLPDISALYRSIDVVFTMSHTECFYFPALEGLAAGKLSIAPKYGGQLDFLNSSNSLLIEGKEVQANQKSMYWESNPNAIWFNPDINDAVDKLKYAYQNYKSLNQNIEMQKEQLYKDYSWKNVTNQFLGLCQ